MAKLKRKTKRIITYTIFIIFTAILFINNITQLLSNWLNLTINQLYAIAFIGAMGSGFYAFWKAMNKEF